MMPERDARKAHPSPRCHEGLAHVGILSDRDAGGGQEP
jgi:hypothetical protein